MWGTKSNDNLINGNSNSVNGSENVIVGNNNAVNGSGNVAIGIGNTVGIPHAYQEKKSNLNFNFNPEVNLNIFKL